MEKIIFAIKNGNRIDVLLATASALTSLFMLADIPVWAVFIGWTWYLSLGANWQAMKESTATAILGAVLALSAIVCTDALTPYLPWLLPNMVGVFPNILALIVSFKIKGVQPLVGFNAFSCIFAGYYLGAYPVQEAYWVNIICAFLYITGGNILGILEGWVVEQLCRKVRYAQLRAQRKKAREKKEM